MPITLIPKPDKMSQEKFRPVSYEYWHKNPQQNTCELKPTNIKRGIHYMVYPRNVRLVQHLKTS